MVKEKNCVWGKSGEKDIEQVVKGPYKNTKRAPLKCVYKKKSNQQLFEIVDRQPHRESRKKKGIVV